MKPLRLGDGRMRASVLVAAVLALLALAGAPSLAATAAPAHAHYRGQTYGQWSADWWNWAFSVPASDSPLVGDNPCDVNQDAKVFFLAGSTTSDPVSRDCVVRTGTPLLIPALNTVCSPLTNDPPDALAACAAANIDKVTSASITVDGRAVRVVRAASKPFTLTAVAGNIFGGAAGSGPAVADGYWTLLHPLRPGTHVIHISATAPSLGFSQDITYELTVVRGRGPKPRR